MYPNGFASARAVLLKTRATDASVTARHTVTLTLIRIVFAKRSSWLDLDFEFPRCLPTRPRHLCLTPTSTKASSTGPPSLPATMVSSVRLSRAATDSCLLRVISICRRIWHWGASQPSVPKIHRN